MSPVIEKILEEAKKLTDEEREQLMDALNELPPVPVDPVKRRELADRSFGMFAHVRTSSEDFCARKQEEIDLEERKFRR
jgi:hypothetical protein